MGRQMLVTSWVTSKFLRSYLLNGWPGWPYNFRNGFEAQKLPATLDFSKIWEMMRVLGTGWSDRECPYMQKLGIYAVQICECTRQGFKVIPCVAVLSIYGFKKGKKKLQEKVE